MDSMFRQRFEQEKDKVRKGGKSTPATVSAAGRTAAGAPGKGGSSFGASGAAGAITQTHVVMTETGIARRDARPAAGAGAAATSSTTHAAGEKGRKSEKTAHSAPPHPQQAASSQRASGPTATSDPQVAAAALNRASPLTGGAGGFGIAGHSSSSKGAPQLALSATATPAPATALTAPRKIVSEAERAMEERVQRDVQRAFEAEKAKLADAHQGTLASLQQLHEKDVAEIRTSDETRRAASSKQEDEERERRLQQTREKCEELYGDELRTMEREEETLKSKLQKVEAEAARAASGNTQRSQIEEQMRNALAKQRADLEATMKKQHDAAVAAEEAAHTAATEKIAREAQEKVTASQQASQRKMDAEERAMALEVDAQKRKLESQLKDLERQLTRATSLSSTTATTTDGTSRSLTDELARIASAKAAQLRAVESEAKKEREDVQARGESAIADVTKQLHHSLSPGALLNTPTSHPPSFSGDRPMSVMVQGGSVAGSRTTSATLSVAYTQELNRIRMARAKERQDRLAQLKLERDAAVAAASVSPARSLGASGMAGSSTRSDSDALAPSSLEELKAAHTEELEAKKALFSRLEGELKEQLAREASMSTTATTTEQQSALIANAVDAEMELYTQEVLARHARMQLEADAKREKQVADHQLALEAYERKKAEVEARQAREEQEAQEAFIQDKVDAAVKAETARLEAEHTAAMSRLAARYAEERGAAKSEVDEEIDAYERAERQKIVVAAASAMLSAQPPPPQRAASAAVPLNSAASAETAALLAPIEARCAAVSQQLADHEARSEAAKVALDKKLETLRATRAALLTQQQQHQHHLKVLKEENAHLATSLSAAEAQRETARRAASAATPPAAPPPSVSASDTPPSGYRPRVAHAATLRTLEDSYRAEHATLEAELQSWRARVQQLMQEQRRQPQPLPATNAASGAASTTGLNTPRQQLLPNPGSAAASSAVGSVHRTPLLSQPSPIAHTAAFTSLLNTPVLSFPFGDSPWVRRSSSPLKALAAAQPPLNGAGVPLYGGSVSRTGHSGVTVEHSLNAPSTLEALAYSREHQQSLQQRHIALQAAREAWQQQRARELQLQQQQQQPRILPPSSSAAFPHSSGYDSFVLDESRRQRFATPQGRPNPHPQDQLSLVLSKLSSRLDSLSGQAEQLQRHRDRPEHVDVSYGAGDGDTSGTAAVTRVHSSQLRHHAVPHLQEQQTSARPSSVQRKSSRSPHTSRRTSSRQDLSSKWNSLLSGTGRK